MYPLFTWLFFNFTLSLTINHSHTISCIKWGRMGGRDMALHKLTDAKVQNLKGTGKIGDGGGL